MSEEEKKNGIVVVENLPPRTVGISSAYRGARQNYGTFWG